jgi:ATP-dependent exoDNAse (exonuclease V) beta subunit
MLWLPLCLDLPLEVYDLVMTDESQDFNTCQHMMLDRIIKACGGRAIVVGDRNQSLYGFRGADPRSFDRIAEVLRKNGRKLTVLELPVNFRSDAAIITHSQQWVPNLQGHSKASGTVGSIGFFESVDRANNNGTDIELPDGDPTGQNDSDGNPVFKSRTLPLPGKTTNFAFLCRINAPLVVTAYQLIGKGKRVCIIGRSQLGTPLKTLIEGLCGTDPRDSNNTNRISDKVDERGRTDEVGLLTRLDSYFKIQAAKLADEKYKNKLEQLQQNCECIEVICENVMDDKVSSVLAEIERLFTDEPTPNTISLSTVHRAKGLEWEVVFILRPELLPHPSAKTADELQQETNACYVAGTRAKNRLYYVVDWPFGNKHKKRNMSWDRPNGANLQGVLEDMEQELSGEEDEPTIPAPAKKSRKPRTKRDKTNEAEGGIDDEKPF